MRVYLAGPDVFLPDPLARGAELKRICALHGFVGVFPLDPLAGGDRPEWVDLPQAHQIARRNEAHIRSCDLLIANLTPFRGPSADVGTVFELGFMRALGRPVFGWSNSTVLFAERTRQFLGAGGDSLMVEDFGMADNLMIEGAILGSGGGLVTCNPVSVWTDLVAFEMVLGKAQEALLF